jgi:lactoylglutathione lyase/glyoxylase I family protein
MSIQVKDMQRCIEFYRDKLGFPVTFTFMKDGHLSGAYFSLGDRSFIEAFEMEKPDGITHFCLETDDMDDFIAQATAKGVACTPKKIGSDGTWQTWLRDPDGNAFEVHQYTAKSMQFLGGECEITWR